MLAKKELEPVLFDKDPTEIVENDYFQKVDNFQILNFIQKHFRG
jgi:hypothetical protein